MDAPPVVSVVIPTFNRGLLLREAVRSVLAQSFRDFELIVADDGSTDGTPDFIRTIDDARVRCVPIAHSGSAAWVRNAGVARARGEWVAFLDSDDLWLPEKLERQLAALRANPRCAWSCTGVTFIDENGTAIRQRAGSTYVPVSGWVLEALITQTATASMTTLMVRRSLLDDIGGFDEALTFRQDYDLALRLAMRAELCALAEPLSCIREHAGRGTKAPRVSELYAWNERVYRKAASAATSRRVRSLCRRQCARQLVARARALSAEGCRIAAARTMVRALGMRVLSSRA
jgi:glycosyltransferase involved in cell wall biosynthesis